MDKIKKAFDPSQSNTRADMEFQPNTSAGGAAPQTTEEELVHGTKREVQPSKDVEAAQERVKEVKEQEKVLGKR